MSEYIDRAIEVPGGKNIPFRVLRASYTDAYMAIMHVAVMHGLNAYVEVLVQDQDGKPMPNVVVEHGWPWQKWPEYDEKVQRVTNEYGKVEWVLFNLYDPAAEMGPCWVRVAGDVPGDVFMGLGIPDERPTGFLLNYRLLTSDED